MSQSSKSIDRIDRAVACLIMARKILDAWPADDAKADDDALALSTASQLISAALGQLIPFFARHEPLHGDADTPEAGHTAQPCVSNEVTAIRRHFKCALN